MSESRVGRFDLLVKDGLGMLADRLGVRQHVQPVIDRYVDEQMEHHAMPMNPESLAERMGVLRSKSTDWKELKRRNRRKVEGR